jgi:hypothetical protein
MSVFNNGLYNLPSQISTALVALEFVTDEVVPGTNDNIDTAVETANLLGTTDYQLVPAQATPDTFTFINLLTTALDLPYAGSWMIVGNLAVINETGFFDAISVDWYSATLSASVGVVWSWETQDETAEGYTLLGLNPTTVINTTEPITIMPRISNQSTSAVTDWAIVADLSDIGNDFSGFSSFSAVYLGQGI